MEKFIFYLLCILTVFFIFIVYGMITAVLDKKQRIKELELMTRSEHSKYHREKEKGVMTY